MNALNMPMETGGVSLEVRTIHGEMRARQRGSLMRLLHTARVGLAVAVGLYGTAWAAGGPPATKIINVADTRTLESGPSLWIAEIYNENYVLFGLVVVVVMVAQGLLLGFGFDRVLHLLGIDLGKLSHEE